MTTKKASDLKKLLTTIYVYTDMANDEIIGYISQINDIVSSMMDDVNSEIAPYKEDVSMAIILSNLDYYGDFSNDLRKTIHDYKRIQDHVSNALMFLENLQKVIK